MLWIKPTEYYAVYHCFKWLLVIQMMFWQYCQQYLVSWTSTQCLDWSDAEIQM